jgi:hypothetical protein
MKKQAINERIHRGFRAWILELGIRAAKTDFLRVEEGRKTAVKLQELITAWEHKFMLESQLFFPALALTAPYSVALLDEEKRMVESKCRQVSRIIQQYVQPGLPQHYASTGKALLDAFSSLASLLLRYMNQQDTLFSAATDSSEAAGWEWVDADATLLLVAEHQLHAWFYPINDRLINGAVQESGTPVPEKGNLRLDEKMGLPSNAGMFYRQAASQA